MCVTDDSKFKLKYFAFKNEVVQNDFTDNYKHIIYKSALGQKLFFKSINDEFDFGSQKYKI